MRKYEIQKYRHTGLDKIKKYEKYINTTFLYTSPKYEIRKYNMSQVDRKYEIRKYNYLVHWPEIQNTIPECSKRA